MNARLKLFWRRRKKNIVIFTLCFLSAVFICTAVLCRLPEAVYSLAEVRVYEVMSVCMNEAAARYTEEYGTDGIYRIGHDKDGYIQSLEVQSTEASRLKNTVAEYVRNNINEKKAELSVPVGNFLGGLILSGRGGVLNIRILSVPYVHTDIESELIQAGINQTEHTVSVVTECTVSAMLGTRSFEVKCTDKVVLSKTLIVGKIPSSYSKIELYDEGTKTWLDKYVH